MAEDLSSLSPEERSKRLLKRLSTNGGTSSIVEPSALSFDPDLVPEVDFNKSAEDKQLDAVLDNIDIIDAYVKFIGKMQPLRGNKTEGVKISCPLPTHPDTNPSAWINTETQLWNCGGCQIGGDVYDLAAIHFGYDLQSYKSKANFPILRRQLAEAFGYTVLRGAVEEYVIKNPPEDVTNVQPLPVVDPPSVPGVEPIPGMDGTQQYNPLTATPGLASVTPIWTAPSSVKEDHQEDENRDLWVPWDKIFPHPTFARAFMEACTIDDLPHEFYFYLALQALGFAGGHNNVMSDFQDIKPNIFVCLYGRTGLGKSRSMRPYLRLLEDVFPFVGDQTMTPEGVRILPTPGSGESIIDAFRWDMLDPSTNKVAGQAPISGLLRHEELSGLVSKAARSGSSIKEVLIEMYDVHGGDVTTMSRTSGVSRAHNPFCQMVSTTQPNAIHAFLRRVDIENGFLNRWIFAAGVPRRSPIAYGGVVQDMTVPTALLKDVYVWARQGHRFALEGDALDAWTAWFMRELAPFKSGEVAQESIFSRIDLTLKKIIIQMTIDEKLDQPSGDLVERALMLYPYLQTTYSMFAQDITFNDVTDCQNRILDLISKYEEVGKSMPSKRDFVRLLARRFNGEIIIRSLRNLVDLGMVDENPTITGGKGRPTIRYALPMD